MDNKQNRQFFWNVKDFLTKSHNPAPVAPRSSVRDTINKVVSIAPPVPVPVNEIVNSSSDTKNSVTRFLSAFGSAKNKQMPQDKTRAKNITTNPFNLQEAFGNNLYGASVNRSLDRLPPPAGVLAREKDDTFTFRSLQQSTPDANLEDPMYKQNVQEFEGMNQQEDDTWMFPKASNALNYVDMNLMGGMTVKKKNTAIPGSQPASTTPAPPPLLARPDDAPKMTPSPIGDDMKKAPKPSSFSKKSEPSKLRSPMKASTNEILYGHSVRAYK